MIRVQKEIVEMHGTKDELFEELSKIVFSFIAKEGIEDYEIVTPVVTAFMLHNKIEEFFKIVEHLKGFDFEKLRSDLNLKDSKYMLFDLNGGDKKWNM